MINEIVRINNDNCYHAIVDFAQLCGGYFSGVPDQSSVFPFGIAASSEVFHTGHRAEVNCVRIWSVTGPQTTRLIWLHSADHLNI